MASSAREQITAEMGPEFEELRKPLQELTALRAVDPRAAVSRFLIEDQPAMLSWPVAPVRPSAPLGTPSTVDMEAT